MKNNFKQLVSLELARLEALAYKESGSYNAGWYPTKRRDTILLRRRRRDKSFIKRLLGL